MNEALGRGGSGIAASFMEASPIMGSLATGRAMCASMPHQFSSSGDRGLFITFLARKIAIFGEGSNSVSFSTTHAAMTSTGVARKP
jgi:hypothetical protein